MGQRATDIAILGGGLAGGLLALALARHRPDLSLLLIERGERFGGNHVWSFFATDVADADRPLVDPLVASAWDAYDVRFPAYSRTLPTPYRSITSEKLDAELRRALPADALLTGADVLAATPASATLAEGRTIAARAVIDTRGAAGFASMAGGWQKFVGRMLRLDRPHGMARPVVMDATVAQHDGYRFVYCLPFGPDTIFVEDTYYASGATLDTAALGCRIEDYCLAAGWTVAEVLREEKGVLPVIAQGDFEQFWPANDGGPARGGSRAALVHPLTSYSLPDALRFARFVTANANLPGAALAAAARDHARRHWRQGRFYRTLARLLYGAAQPAARYRVLEHFYRRPQGLVERFYAGRSTAMDAVRILSGRPPVAIGAAAACLMGGGRPLSPLAGTAAEYAA